MQLVYEVGRPWVKYFTEQSELPILLWTFILAALIVAVLVATLVIGWKAPKAHTVTREAEFAQTVEALWAAVADFASLPAWMPGIRRVQKLDAVDGRERWRYQTVEGDMTVEVVRRSEPSELVIRTVNSDLGFGGTWTYRISPATGGSLVTIGEEGWVANPFFRFMTRYVFGEASTVEQTLLALGRRFREKVRPRAARAARYPEAAPRRDPVDVEPRESATPAS